MATSVVSFYDLRKVLRELRSFEGSWWSQRNPAEFEEGLNPAAMKFAGEIVFLFLGLKPCVILTGIRNELGDAYVRDVVLNCTNMCRLISCHDLRRARACIHGTAPSPSCSEHCYNSCCRTYRLRKVTAPIQTDFYDFQNYWMLYDGSSPLASLIEDTLFPCSSPQSFSPSPFSSSSIPPPYRAKGQSGTCHECRCACSTACGASSDTFSSPQLDSYMSYSCSRLGSSICVRSSTISCGSCSSTLSGSRPSALSLSLSQRRSSLRRQEQESRDCDVNEECTSPSACKSPQEGEGESHDGIFQSGSTPEDTIALPLDAQTPDVLGGLSTRALSSYLPSASSRTPLASTSSGVPPPVSSSSSSAASSSSTNHLRLPPLSSSSSMGPSPRSSEPMAASPSPSPSPSPSAPQLVSPPSHLSTYLAIVSSCSSPGGSSMPDPSMLLPASAFVMPKHVSEDTIARILDYPVSMLELGSDESALMEVAYIDRQTGDVLTSYGCTGARRDSRERVRAHFDRYRKKCSVFFDLCLETRMV